MTSTGVEPVFIGRKPIFLSIRRTRHVGLVILAVPDPTADECSGPVLLRLSARFWLICACNCSDSENLPACELAFDLGTTYQLEHYYITHQARCQALRRLS